MAGHAHAPAVTTDSNTRRIALIVPTWSQSIYPWSFLKQYLLRRVETGGCTALDPSDKLFIVKAGKADEEGERWKMGGPLVPDLDTALAHYPATVVRLEGSVRSSIRTFLERNSIDVLVVGEHWPSSGLQLTSVSEWVKQNVSCPFLIIRRAAVANARMKISSSQSPLASPQSAGAGESIPPESFLSRLSPTCPRTASMTGRRIAIAYTGFASGRGLLQFARDKLLNPNDEIYLVHVFNKQENPVVHQTMKLMRAMTMQKAESAGEVTLDNSISFGAAELEGYKTVHLNVVLQGDVKSALTSFCSSEDIELLVIGTRSGGKIKKRLGGGSVSSFLIDHAPCPCLVVPYKHMGVDDSRDAADEEALGTSPPASPGSWLAAGMEMVTGKAEPSALAAADSRPGSGGSGGSGELQRSSVSDALAQLQQQLKEKDLVIADLRRQVRDLQESQDKSGRP